MDEFTITREEFQQIKDDIKVLYSRTNASDVWQAKYGEKIDTIEKNVEKLTKLVEGLSALPQKRWDTTITSIITAIVAATVAFFIGKLTGK